MRTKKLPIIYPSITFFQETTSRLFSHPSALFGLSILTLLFTMAIFGPIFSSHNYSDIALPLKNLPPSKLFWFGTDELGRDIFVRTWWGARISLFVGIMAAIIDVFIGVIWGTLAAINSKKIDTIMMRFCDILYAIPYLLITILLLVVIGPGLMTIIFAISIIGWINMARIVRGEILHLKQMDFILAAHAIGASKKRIVFHHLLPNILPPIIATMTLTIPSAIFTEAFLSFLGLGVQAPVASWGVMINDALFALRFYPWRLFFPSIMIILTMLGFNLLGDAFCESLDPRLRK